MSAELPLVSVILPAYNAEEYIREAVDSILQQTFTDFELNIIDDGSKDGTYGILKDLAQSDGRIHLVSRENHGLQRTLNELIAMSCGKYLARMDADDVSLPVRLERQVAFMEAHPEIAALGSRIRIIDREEERFFNDYPSPEVRGMRMLFKNAGLAHPASMIRREFLDRHQIRYNENNIGAEDYNLWSDITIAGGLLDSIDEVLFLYREHPGQITQVYTEETRYWNRMVQQDQLRRYGIIDEEKAEMLFHWYEHGLSYPTAEYFAFFQQLREGNRENQVYAPEAFEAELAFQWVAKAISQAKRCRDFSMLKPTYLKGLGKYRNYVMTEIKKIRNH